MKPRAPLSKHIFGKRTPAAAQGEVEPMSRRQRRLDLLGAEQ
jgi:hypothetical protein